MQVQNRYDFEVLTCSLTGKVPCTSPANRNIAVRAGESDYFIAPSKHYFSRVGGPVSEANDCELDTVIFPLLDISRNRISSTQIALSPDS